jgi:Glycosyl hydrolases family 2, sugar binding domain/Glycosyl hydrolases family 2/Glycosyl hydrolases family 2, TIM barrel domain
LKKVFQNSFFLLLFILASICIDAQRIMLAGEWQFAIDRDDKGIAEKWFNKKLSEKIILPGSMAERGKGDNVTLQTKWTGSIYDSSFFFRPSLAKYRTPDNLKIPFWLTPAKYYVGRAWYQREINIPADWKGRRTRLFLERVHIQTKVWIDGIAAGESNSLSVAQEFDLGRLAAGKHIITISVDNRIKDMNVGPDSHSVSDHTQGNWNGIIGKMYVDGLPDVCIADVQVYPDVQHKLSKVKIFVANKGVKETRVIVTASAESFNTSVLHNTQEVFDNVPVKPGDTVLVELNLPMTDNMVTWNEFDPALYRLTAKVEANDQIDTKKVQFGMREFTTKGTQFMVNGRPVFLRGTLNNCEFPLTGYPSMDVTGWEKIFKTAKLYGLNHMRFHSWCPPEAAFIAADKAGFYLQPEAPTWPNHGTSVGDGRFIDQYIYDETKRMVKAYGNYASFCMLAAGNEPAGKNQAKYLADFVNYWKDRDKRHLYTGASVAMSWPLVPENEYMVKSGPRGLKWTNAEPESNSSYYAAIKEFVVPYVTHEMGQWCVFPNFEEIKKYTGVYKARNFELFKQDLEDHGMAEQAKDFLMASGKLQALCYKAEIEKDLRTPGLAGFQLLGLQDFPGQGTALVGVIDAFWDDKGYINARQFSRFCSATVPLAELPKFVFTNDETIEAAVQLFHFGKVELKNVLLNWVIKNDRGDVLKSGNFGMQTFGVGAAQPVGKLSIPLNDIPIASHLKLEIAFDKLPISNDWDIWVYPAKLPATDPGIYYCTSFDEKAQDVLDKGGIVFLNAAGKVVKGKEIAMQFTPVFWNTSWFKMRPPHVTGMLIQATHPAFAYFPTTDHSDYQWWSIVSKAQVMHLEDFPKGFKPIVQPIDTWFMNRKLGLLFEAKVGNGKLIISSADISDTSSFAACRQLYYSVRKYMLSDKFNPGDKVELSVIKDLFVSPSKETWDSYTTC